MHPAAEDGFSRMLAHLLGWYDQDHQVQVLDIGGANVNGVVHDTVHRSFQQCQITTVDIAPGVGVDVVADMTTPHGYDAVGYYRDGCRRTYDIVICTEVLEHVEHWRRIVRNSTALLAPDGGFVGTCAGPGRPRHGARGEVLPSMGEWYANVNPWALAEELAYHFDDVTVEYSVQSRYATTHDLYWCARKLQGATL